MGTRNYSVYLAVKRALCKAGINYTVAVRSYIGRRGTEKEREIGIRINDWKAVVVTKEGNIKHVSADGYKIFKPVDFVEYLKERGVELETEYKDDKPKKLVFAEELRNNPTPEEVLFKAVLDKSGVEYETQVVIGPYVADFVLYGTIIVEIDGGYHRQPEQVAYDGRRSAYLNTKGYAVIRISNEDVEKGKYPPLINRLIG